MSTILDALKRVEESIRIEAEQRAADGLQGHPDPSKSRTDASIQFKNAAAGESDEVMEVYTGIVNMLSRIQDQVRTVKDEVRAESRGANAELSKAVTALQNDLIRQRDAIQREFQKRDVDRTADHAKLAEAHSQNDALKRTLVETKGNHAELAKAVTALQSEFLRQRDAIQKEFQKRDAERAAGNARLAESQSQTDTLKKVLAETKKTCAELAKALAALQSEFIFQRDALQKESQKRDAERAAGNAKLAESQSQTEALKRMLAEIKAAHAELAKAAAALQGDAVRQRDAVQKEFQKRDADRVTVGAKLAEAQSQADALKKMLADTSATCTDLAKAVTLLQNDLVRQRDAILKEFQKRDAERAAGNAKLAEAQTQTDALKKMLAEVKASHGELAQAITALRDDAMRQKEAMQKESQRRSAEQEAGGARLAELHAQTDFLKKSLAGADVRQAQLAQALTELQSEFARHIGLIQKEFQRRDAERGAGNATAAESLCQVDAMKALLGESRETQAALARNVAALQKDLALQKDALQEELRRRDTERGTGASSKAAPPPQDDAMKALLAETRDTQAALAQTVAALQNDLALQKEALQQESRKRDAEQGAGSASKTKSAPQDDAVKALLAETRETHAALAQTVAALQNDLALQREALGEESRKRDAEREAGQSALAAIQTQADALKQLVTHCESALAEAQRGGIFETAAAQDAQVRHEPFDAAPTPVLGEAQPKPRVDKDEAIRLHSAAREAYKNGDFTEALRLLDIIDAAFPRNKSVLYNRAQCLMDLGRNDEARKLCDYLATALDHAPALALKKQIRD